MSSTQTKEKIHRTEVHTHPRAPPRSAGAGFCIPVRLLPPAPTCKAYARKSASSPSPKISPSARKRRDAPQTEHRNQRRAREVMSKGINAHKAIATRKVRGRTFLHASLRQNTFGHRRLTMRRIAIPMRPDSTYPSSFVCEWPDAESHHQRLPFNVLCWIQWTGVLGAHRP